MYWNKKNYSKGFWFWQGVKMLFGMALFTFLFGAGFMLLWNAIIPSVFGLVAITFWQSLGLMLIGRMLFGGFRKRRHGWGRKRKHQMFYQHCQRMNEQQVTVG